jgi:hypothetical protein
MAGGKFKKQRRNQFDLIPKYREHNGMAERIEGMKVGQLSEAAGVSVQAIRFDDRTRPCWGGLVTTHHSIKKSGGLHNE